MKEPELISGDGGGAASFRLVSETGRDLFLTIFNFHNGYYSHGFEMTVGDESLLDGYL